MKPYTLLTLLLLVCQMLMAQAHLKPKSADDHNAMDTLLSWELDSAVVITGKKGLFVQDFIDAMLSDSVLYEGFRKMKNYSFTADNDITTFDKKYRPTAHIYKKIEHDNSGYKHKQKILVQVDSGEVFKRNGKYELFTVQMFSYIFENENNSDFIDKSMSKGEKSPEGYKDKLKTLIFNPGKPVKGVPFVSSKTAIFEPDMRPYYDYQFFKGTYMGDIPVYRFKCTVKREYANSSKVMIKELNTIFDANSFQILGRYIDMSYDNMAFSFDIKMNIEMNYVGDDLLPVLISYSGDWDVPMKKKEIAAFTVRHMDYKHK